MKMIKSPCLMEMTMPIGDPMKFQLKSKGAHVWDVVASKKWYLKNKTRISKDDQKFNYIALKIIKRSLSNDVKMRLGTTPLQEIYG